MSAYSNPDPERREKNFQIAMLAVLLFMRRGVTVYSPIVSCHPIAEVFNLETDHHFWTFQNQAMMEISERAVIVALPGWGNSAGIKAEIEFYSSLGKPIGFLSAEEFTEELSDVDLSILQEDSSESLQPSFEPSPVSDR